MIPQRDQIYRHFKGNLYRIVTMAKHSETGENMVVYQALYGEYQVYTRPLSMFLEEVDQKKYPQATQKFRFELVKEMVQVSGKPAESTIMEEPVTKEAVTAERIVEKENREVETGLDPLLEAYLDADSYRERMNILHGLQDRITDAMINTMAVVIDVEIPEGDLNTRYAALHQCLATREKYECNRLTR